MAATLEVSTNDFNVPAPRAGSGTTDVTMTLKDIGGTVWVGATVTAIFVPVPNVPGPYYWQGTTNWTKVHVATSDAGGIVLFTAANNDALQDNTFITPLNSMWQFVVAPAATMPAVVFTMMIAGTSMDISSIFTSQSYQVQNTQVQSLFVPRAYQDSEVAVVPNIGQIYFNTASKQLKVYTGTPEVGWTNMTTFDQSAAVAEGTVDLDGYTNTGVYMLYEFVNGPTGVTAGLQLASTLHVYSSQNIGIGTNALAWQELTCPAYNWPNPSGFRRMGVLNPPYVSFSWAPWFQMNMTQVGP